MYIILMKTENELKWIRIWNKLKRINQKNFVIFIKKKKTIKNVHFCCSEAIM